MLVVVINVFSITNVIASEEYGLVPCYDDCTAEHLLGTVNDPIWAKIIRAGMGVAGSFILLVFVIGGFMFVVSGGNGNTIKKGKSMMFSSIIGILIVSFSYLAVRLIVSFLAGDKYRIFFGQGS